MFALLQLLTLGLQHTSSPVTDTGPPLIDDDYLRVRMQRATELRERAEQLLQTLQETKPQRPA